MAAVSAERNKTLASPPHEKRPGFRTARIRMDQRSGVSSFRGDNAAFPLGVDGFHPDIVDASVRQRGEHSLDSRAAMNLSLNPSMQRCNRFRFNEHLNSAPPSPSHDGAGEEDQQQEDSSGNVDIAKSNNGTDEDKHRANQSVLLQLTMPDDKKTFSIPSPTSPVKVGNVVLAPNDFLRAFEEKRRNSSSKRKKKKDKMKLKVETSGSGGGSGSLSSRKKHAPRQRVFMWKHIEGASVSRDAGLVPYSVPIEESTAASPFFFYYESLPAQPLPRPAPCSQVSPTPGPTHPSVAVVWCSQVTSMARTTRSTQRCTPRLWITSVAGCSTAR